MEVAVSKTIDVDDGSAPGVTLYVPFRGFDRSLGPVGTLDVKAVALGDATGGSVAISIRMRKEEFGFHPLWVPTMISIEDNLATVENPEVIFRGLGNERLIDEHCENVTMVASLVGSRNCGKVQSIGFIIEPDQPTPNSIVTCTWATNTDTLAYNVHMYGVIFDGEAMARGKHAGSAVSPLLAGVR